MVEQIPLILLSIGVIMIGIGAIFNGRKVRNLEDRISELERNIKQSK